MVLPSNTRVFLIAMSYPKKPSMIALTFEVAVIKSVDKSPVLVLKLEKYPCAGTIS